MIAFYYANYDQDKIYNTQPIVQWCRLITSYTHTRIIVWSDQVLLITELIVVRFRAPFTPFDGSWCGLWLKNWKW